MAGLMRNATRSMPGSVQPCVAEGTPVRVRQWLRRGGRMVCLCLLTLTLTACSVNQSSAYTRAVATFASGDYAQAATDFAKLGDYQQAATYAAYSQGLVLYEQGDFAAAVPYFEQTQDFMYGKQRYAYCQAAVLQDAGTFDQAAAQFAALGNYEDAASRALYCTARAAEDKKDYDTALYDYAAAGSYSDANSRLENLQSQVYQYAKQLKTDQDYGQALALFSLLGDYLGARTEAKDCKDFFRDQQYDEADANESAGQLQAAYDLFVGLSGYRDAQTRASDLAAKLNITPVDEQEPATETTQ